MWRKSNEELFRAIFFNESQLCSKGLQFLKVDIKRPRSIKIKAKKENKNHIQLPFPWIYNKFKVIQRLFHQFDMSI